MPSDSGGTALLAQILSTGDSSTILVYADWLEERGDELSDVLRRCESREIEGDDETLDDILDRMDGGRQRWFAANCAERTLPIYERRYPDDPRPREILRTVREFVLGRGSEEDLRQAELVSFDADWESCITEENPRLAAWNAASLAAAEAAWSTSRVEEARWQAAHATKILHLGLIPLTELERTELAVD